MTKRILIMALGCVLSFPTQAFNASACWQDVATVGGYGLIYGGIGVNLLDKGLAKARGADVPESRTKAIWIGMPLASGLLAFLIDSPCKFKTHEPNKTSFISPFVSENNEIGISIYKSF